MTNRVFFQRGESVRKEMGKRCLLKCQLKCALIAEETASRHFAYIIWHTS